jgi:hypothetical protein
VAHDVWSYPIGVGDLGEFQVSCERNVDGTPLAPDRWLAGRAGAR